MLQPSPGMTPLRSLVRDAVSAAWARAVASGALPARRGRGPAGCRGRAAGQRRARRLRHEPGDEARPALPPAAPADRRGPRPPRSTAEAGRAGLGPGRRSRWPRPGSSTCAWPIAALEDLVAGVLARPAAWGGLRAARAAARQRGVRLGQPDRPAPHRQRPRRVRRRPPLPRARGGRPRGHPRVLLQRLRGPGPEPRRLGASRSAAGPRSPRTATAAPTCTSWRASCRPTSGRPPRRWATATTRSRARRRASTGVRRRIAGRGHRRAAAKAPDAPPDAGRDAAWIVGELGLRAGARRDRGLACQPRRPLRRLEERGLALSRGLGRAGRRAPSGLGPPLRAGRRPLVPLDRLRRRQGPRRPQVERRLHVLRRPTSATSSRSSAAASTTSSTSGAPTTTGRWRGCAMPRRRWASTGRPCR